MDDRIAVIKARLEAATPGPWRHFPPPTNRLVAGGDDLDVEVAHCRVRSGAGDAELIANAPADIAYLLDLVGRMLPLINHSERAECPMAFHRSDGEECTCGALDIVRETGWLAPTKESQS